MKKILLSSIIVCSGLIFSCKEKIPVLTKGGEAVSDTTFIAAVETQSPRMVLIEEATGVKCVNCPGGAAILKNAQTSYPGRLIIIAEHDSSLFSRPIKEYSKDTFGLQAVTELFEVFGGEPSKPAAIFDRSTQSGIYFLEGTSKWISTIAERTKTPSPLNLTVASSYDSLSQEFLFTIRGAYTEAVSNKQNLSIMLLESKIIDAQETVAPQYLIEDYEHNHVLRAFVTAYLGDPIIPEISPIEPGRVFIKTYSYKIPPHKQKWVKENMTVVAFVHNSESGNHEVLQATETHLLNH